MTAPIADAQVQAEAFSALARAQVSLIAARFRVAMAERRIEHGDVGDAAFAENDVAHRAEADALARTKYAWLRFGQLAGLAELHVHLVELPPTNEEGPGRKHGTGPDTNGPAEQGPSSEGRIS